jgi:hypothetical protein
MQAGRWRATGHHRNPAEARRGAQGGMLPLPRFAWCLAGRWCATTAVLTPRSCLQDAISILRKGEDFRPSSADEWRCISDAVAKVSGEVMRQSPAGHRFFEEVQRRMAREDNASHSAEEGSGAEEAEVRFAGPSVLAMIEKFLQQPVANTPSRLALRKDVFEVMEVMIRIRNRVARTRHVGIHLDLSKERQTLAALFRKHRIPFAAMGLRVLPLHQAGVMSIGLSYGLRQRTGLLRAATPPVAPPIRKHQWVLLQNPDRSVSLACRPAP